MSEETKEPKKTRAEIRAMMFSTPNQVDEVSLESALHSNHTSEETYEIVDGDDDHQFIVVDSEDETTEIADEIVAVVNNAPTTKVQNMIDEGLEVEYRANTYAYARGDEYEGYSIALCNGQMPPFEVRNFETIQELANGMRELASLRNWRKLVPDY